MFWKHHFVPMVGIHKNSILYCYWFCSRVFFLSLKMDSSVIKWVLTTVPLPPLLLATPTSSLPTDEIHSSSLSIKNRTGLQASKR